MLANRLPCRFAAAALLVGWAGSIATAQTGGVTFAFFGSSSPTKPDLITRATAYDPAVPAGGGIKVWSATTAAVGFSTSSTAVNDLFGFSASSAGDVNGDGMDDVVVGAPLSSVGGSNAGSIQIFSPDSGNLLLTINGTSSGQMLGMAAAGIGDVDGDTLSDVAAAGFLNTGSSMRPAVFVYSGSNGDLLRVYDSNPGDGFGYLVRGLGDLNGDGEVEMAVVAPRRTDATTGLTVAAVDIITPAAAGDNRVTLKLSTSDKCIIDVNVVSAGGVTFLDVVTMATDGAYGHTLFSLDGIKVQSTIDTDILRFKDVNKDNKIDMEDIWLILDNMDTDVEPGNPFNLDLNKDGKVDADDLVDIVSAATGEPILKELSPFAQNRLTEMGEQFPLYFAVTAISSMTTAEAMIADKKVDCAQCGNTQQKSTCSAACCGPGSWVFVYGTPTTTRIATVDSANVTATATTLAAASAASCSGSIDYEHKAPYWGGSAPTGIIVTSTSGSGSVSWNVLDNENWSGSGPKCKRDVRATCQGTGGLIVGLRTDPYAGNSAGGSASGSSTGNGAGASATLTLPSAAGSITIAGTSSSTGLVASLAAPTPGTTPPGGGQPANGSTGGTLGVSANFTSGATVTGQCTLDITGSYTAIGKYPVNGAAVCTDDSFSASNLGQLDAGSDLVGHQTGITYGWYYAKAKVRSKADMKVSW